MGHGVVDATDRILENLVKLSYPWAMELLILQTESWSTFSNNPAHVVVDTTDRIMEYIVKQSCPWSC